MEIPKKIKILGLNWNIVLSKVAAEEGEYFGRTKYANQEILIDPSATQQYKEKTLLHEILHACWWQSGLSKDEQIPKNVEEKIVHALSSCLYQVIKENKLTF